MDLEAIRSLGTGPISAASPAGESVRYEPEFEQLSTEIEKLTSVEQTPVDWRVVVNLSSDLLKGKGKDLLVASYLAFGLLEQKGYNGLAAGIEAINGLVENFWEGLFPELRRLRARIAALEWLASRLEKSLGARSDPGANEREGLEQCIAGLARLLADEANHFQGDAPNVGPARRALKAKLDTIPQPEPEPEPAAAEETVPDNASESAAPTAAPTAVAPPPPPPPPPEPEPANDPDAVRVALKKFHAQQVEYAAILRDSDDTDPHGYLLLREAVWSQATIADRERESVGDAEFLSVLAKDLEAGEYDSVLARTEKLMAEHPLWLDLQLMTVRALEELGRRYARARSAVIGSLAFLLQRVPDLAEAKNHKGESFASDAAQVWLRNEVLAASETHSANDPAEVGKEARKLVARGQLGDAMRLLTQRIEMTASRRGRFVLRLDLAQLCIEAGRLELAVPQLEQLEQEVTHFSLEEWEPDLATSVVRWLWECCAGAAAAPSLAERSKDIYARLCRLDPAAAVSAKGPQGD